MGVVVTGGGTGGHIYPALAIAEAIQKKYPEIDILYIGSETGLEADIVPKTGLPFAAVSAKGLNRRLSIDTLRTLATTVKGLDMARRILKKFKANTVIGTGGFVCGPVMLAAKGQGASLFLHEQNAYPGITNRLLAPLADGVMLNFSEARARFKGRTPLYVTGLPVRHDVGRYSRTEGAAHFGLDPSKKTLLVTGGSRGARTINRTMAQVLPQLLQRPDLQVIFISGRNGYEETRGLLTAAGLSPTDTPGLVFIDYLYEMPLALAAADLAIGRAGATFLAELSACGLPAVLLPYPYASENHQAHNAQAIVDAGAAEMILDGDCTGPLMLDTVARLLDDDNRLATMAVQMKALAKPNALADIMQVLEEGGHLQ